MKLLIWLQEMISSASIFTFLYKAAAQKYWKLCKDDILLKITKILFKKLKSHSRCRNWRWCDRRFSRRIKRGFSSYSWFSTWSSYIISSCITYSERPDTKAVEMKSKVDVFERRREITFSESLAVKNEMNSTIRWLAKI